MFTYLGLLTKNFYFYAKIIRIWLQSYYLVASWLAGSRLLKARWFDGEMTDYLYIKWNGPTRPVIFVPPALKFRGHLISIVDFKQTLLN